MGATALPDRVSVAMTEIAENMHEGLLALAVGAGLQVMQALMEVDVTTLAGPKGKHDRARTAVRHGRERGSVTLGGRRVPVTRPRVRAADGAGELPIPSYELFSSTEILGKMAMEKMLAGLSARRYPVGLEPVGEQVGETSSATSKSAVSHRFVAMTETALAELLSQDLSGLDLVALMIDGCISPNPAVWWPSVSASTGSSTRWRWWRARRRTRPWSPTCSSACGNGVWT